MITLYGKNSVLHALDFKENILEVFLVKDVNYNFDFSGLKLTYLTKQEMNNRFLKHHQNIALLRKDYKTYELTDLIKTDCKRILLLDGITDPHNLGAILRTVDAFSFDYVILPNNNSCPLNDTVAHTSAGAIEYVKCIYVNSLVKTINTLKENGFWLVGTDMHGTSYEEIDPSLKLCLVIGSEGFGISKTVKKQCDFNVAIKMSGHVNSLNASVATAILLEHFKL